MEDASSTGISTLSTAQDKALSILPIFASLWSCLGSAQIIYMVLVTSRRTTPYRRILLGLSVSDFLCSLIYPWQAFLVPRNNGNNNRVWAIGTPATCTFLGFGQQIFFASISYNAMLSVYFLLTVRYGISNELVAKRYEPWMHLIAIGWSLTTAIVGIGMGVFHELELGHGCWVNDYPEGCGVCNYNNNINNINNFQDVTCNAVPCTDNWIAIVFGGIPAIIAFALIVVNNLLVYRHVRNTIQRTRKRFHNSIDSKSNHKNTTNGMTATTGAAAGAASATTSQPASASSTANGGKHSSSALRQLSTTFRNRLRSSLSGNNNHSHDPQLQRIRAVAVQATWYVVAFLITYIASFSLRILAAVGFGAAQEDQLFALLVIQAICLPSQGFLNLMVYIRPSFLRTRRDYPHESYSWCFRRAMYGEKVPPTKDDVKRRPSSSDFGLLVVRPDEMPWRNNQQQSPHQQHSSNILQAFGMDGDYGIHSSGDEIDDMDKRRIEDEKQGESKVKSDDKSNK